MSKPVSDLGSTLFIAHAGRSATFTASPWLPFGLRAMSLPHTLRRGKLVCRTKSRPNGGTHSGEVGRGIGGRGVPPKETPFATLRLGDFAFLSFWVCSKATYHRENDS